MEEEMYVLIDRYLSGELSEAERKVFEEKVKNDADLAEKVNVYQSMTSHLASHFSAEKQQALEELKRNLASISKEHLQPGHTAKVVPLKWYYWAAAASVALICLVIYRNSSTVPEYTAYAVHEPLALAERGSDSLYYLAEHAFNEKHYDEALRHFDRLLTNEPGHAEVSLYKGIALLELGDLEQAKPIFNTLKDSNAVYKDKALWYLALTALKEKNYDQCRMFLQQIPEGSEKHDEAREMLDDL